MARGQGSWPAGGARSWAWYLPTDSRVDELISELGPITGTDSGSLDAEGLKALFDETTEDLWVVSWWQNASGECAEAHGLWLNTVVDCVCVSASLLRQSWDEEMSLPAKFITTVVYKTADQGMDASPESLQFDVIETVEEIPAP